jgi:hypothetical protein
MNRRLRIAPALALVALVGTVGAATLQAKDSRFMTRGSLAIELARATGYNSTDASKASQSEAAKALTRLGIELGGRLGDAVSERDLVEIGTAVGAKVKSSTPDRGVTDKKGRAFAVSLKPTLEGIWASIQSSGTMEIHVSCKGRDSRAGRRGTPASPANPNATAPPCP